MLRKRDIYRCLNATRHTAGSTPEVVRHAQLKLSLLAGLVGARFVLRARNLGASRKRFAPWRPGDCRVPPVASQLW